MVTTVRLQKCGFVLYGKFIVNLFGFKKYTVNDNKLYLIYKNILYTLLDTLHMIDFKWKPLKYTNCTKSDEIWRDIVLSSLNDNVYFQIFALMAAYLP